MSDAPAQDQDQPLEAFDAQAFQLNIFLAGAQTAGAGKARLKALATFEVVKSSLSALTGPVGADMIVDINDDGVSIYTTQANRPKIVDGAQDTTDANAKAPDNPVIAAGSIVTIDMDQIGVGTPGSNVMVSILASKR